MSTASHTRVAYRFLTAAPIRDLLQGLHDLEELDENINEVIDTFGAHYKMARAMDTEVASQLDALTKAKAGLQTAQGIAAGLEGILKDFPGDKTAQRAAKDAAVMIKRFEKNVAKTTKMVKTLSKKQMPAELIKAAQAVTAMFKRLVVDPKTITVKPWQKMTKDYRSGREGVQFNFYVTINRKEGDDLQFILLVNTVSNDGLKWAIVRQGTSPYDLKAIKTRFLNEMAGHTELKGEGDKNSQRLKVAPEIASIMNSVARRVGDTYGRDPEISKDGREISMATRTQYDEADYGQYDEPDFPDYDPQMTKALSSYSKFIKNISGGYSEKGWYDWTVTLK